MTMLSAIRNKIHNRLSPAFQWIQVEVSSLCNGHCVYCPHTLYKDNWQGSLMSLDTFRKLEPSLKRTKLVYLQGWGEPFLNPDFFHMVSIGKDSGCMVGTTTNGILVDNHKVERIMESGLDIITFSVAGGLDSNDRFRRGSDISQVISTIEYINSLKAKTKSDGPRMHLAYLMLKPNYKDIEKIPVEFAGLGIDQVVISTLDFQAGEAENPLGIFPEDTEKYKDIRALLKEVKKEGERKGLPVNYYLTSTGRDNSSCIENPMYTAFVGADGTVSPCVFTNIPVSNVYYETAAGAREYRRLVFGNINDEPLAAIWRKKNYRRFRKSFENKQLFDLCRECKKLNMMLE